MACGSLAHQSFVVHRLRSCPPAQLVSSSRSSRPARVLYSLLPPSSCPFARSPGLSPQLLPFRPPDRKRLVLIPCRLRLAVADLRSRSSRTPESILTKQCFFLDMDGVIYHGDRLLPGVKEFVGWLIAEKKRYLFLTNGSVRTPAEIQAKLKRLGLEVPPDVFHTSAISTAMFLQSQGRGATCACPGRFYRGPDTGSGGRDAVAAQTPNGSAYVVGDNGLRTALLEVGFSLTDTDPDYVVVGETNHYTFDMIEKAINLVYRYDAPDHRPRRNRAGD